MMQNQTNQPEIYTCRKCSYDTQNLTIKCLKCGNRMQSSLEIKTLGILLIVLGIVIALGGGLFCLSVFGVLIFNDISDRDVTTAYVAFALSGVVLVTGITVIIGGVWQAKRGKWSKVFVWIYSSVLLY